MKISRSHLRLLILETLDDLASQEREEFGNWIDRIPDLHKAILQDNKPEGMGTRLLKGEMPVVRDRDTTRLKKIINDHGFDYIGKGAFRVVASPKERPEYVVKLLREPSEAYMNQVEHQFQSRFRNLFPKVYKHGAGLHGTPWDWIIVDSVDKILIEGRDFIPFFPKLHKFLLQMGREGKITPDDVELLLDNFDVFMQHIARFYGVGELDESLIFLRDDFIIRKARGERLFSDLKEELMAAARSEPIIHDLAMLVANVNVDLNDINRGNVGMSRDGRFVIIDASIFSNPFR